MWPDLMGPGWQLQLLITTGLLGAFFAVLRLLAVAAARLEANEPPDRLLQLWHRYEEGDLTRQEFERAKRTLREQPAGKNGADRSRRAEVRHAPAS